MFSRVKCLTVKNGMQFKDKGMIVNLNEFMSVSIRPEMSKVACFLANRL